jgi:hypothetical protein
MTETRALIYPGRLRFDPGFCSFIVVILVE